MEVVNIPHRLEVAAADEQVYRFACLPLNFLNGGVDTVQLAVSAAIDCNLHESAAGVRSPAPSARFKQEHRRD
jgi:hypothetical protein